MFTNFISLAVLSSLRNMRGMSHIYRHVGESSGARWLCKSLTCVPFHNSWPRGWRHSLGPTSLVANPFPFEATVPLYHHLPYSCTSKVMTCSAMPNTATNLRGPLGSCLVTGANMNVCASYRCQLTTRVCLPCCRLSRSCNAACHTGVG